MWQGDAGSKINLKYLHVPVTKNTEISQTTRSPVTGKQDRGQVKSLSHQDWWLFVRIRSETLAPCTRLNSRAIRAPVRPVPASSLPVWTSPLGSPPAQPHGSE